MTDNFHGYCKLLGVAADFSFESLKKAYYRKAKLMHPDLRGNSESATEEFRKIVEAFRALSVIAEIPPEKRVSSAVVKVSLENDEIIMDTSADDTLEELIVGNIMPKNSSLMTFFMDLENTAIFITWREARTMYRKKEYHSALQRLKWLVKNAPSNILYRVYLARCLEKFRRYGEAKKHLKKAVALGEKREPPQILLNVRCELERVSRKHRPLLYRIKRFFFPVENGSSISDEEESLLSMNRIVSEMLKEDEVKKLR